MVDLRRASRDSARMGIRLLAGALWLIAVLSICELVRYVTGMPRELGLLLSLAVAVAIVVDPAGWLWTRSGRAAGSPGPRRVGSGRAASNRVAG